MLTTTFCCETSFRIAFQKLVCGSRTQVWQSMDSTLSATNQIYWSQLKRTATFGALVVSPRSYIYIWFVQLPLLPLAPMPSIGKSMPQFHTSLIHVLVCYWLILTFEIRAGTSCYDDILEETHANHTQNCNIFANTLLDDQRGVTCNCVEGGRKLVCNETCQACNRDGTTCATNVGYGYEFDEDGIFNTSFSTFRYDTSTDYTPVDTVNIEVQSFTSFCKVFVNGELCRSCDYVSCVNGFEGYYITCDNIEGVGNFNPCGMDYEDVSIPLNIFAFQDPFVRDGCEPLLWPPSLF